MKRTNKAFAALALAAAISAGPVSAKAETPATLDAARVYSRATAVLFVDQDADLVTVIDAAGYMWDFAGAEDWQEGDGCTMVMYDECNTPDITDDVILSVQYARFDLLA